jgi:hypothetical protein
MLAELFRKKEQKLKWWQVVLPSVLVFGVAYGMYVQEDVLSLFLQYYSYGAVPFMVVLPGLLLCIRRRRAIDEK